MQSPDFTITDKLIELALIEDIGSGDITSEAVLDGKKTGKASIRAKEALVLCGLDTAERVFLKVDQNIKIVKLFSDGDFVREGDIILKAEGSLLSLLKAERTALNFLQRLSGIATNCSQYAEKMKKYPNLRITDTRKTTPGLRILEKYAVYVGGCFNHRTGLYDGVLIKDNHIEAAGGVKEALSLVKNKISHLVRTEVEVKNLEEVHEAVNYGADIIMLDNMDIETMQEAVKIIDKKALVEVSGSVDLEKIDKIASIGVDIISCGALIHHAVFSDLSMSLDSA